MYSAPLNGAPLDGAPLYKCTSLKTLLTWVHIIRNTYKMKEEDARPGWGRQGALQRRDLQGADGPLRRGVPEDGGAPPEKTSALGFFSLYSV